MSNALVMGVFWGPWAPLTRSLATSEPSAFLAVIDRRPNLNLAPLRAYVLANADFIKTTPPIAVS